MSLLTSFSAQRKIKTLKTLVTQHGPVFIAVFVAISFVLHLKNKPIKSNCNCHTSDQFSPDDFVTTFFFSFAKLSSN